MNTKKRFTTGLVGAAVMCATNTIVVHAEEALPPSVSSFSSEETSPRNIGLKNAYGTTFKDRDVEFKTFSSSMLKNYEFPSSVSGADLMRTAQYIEGKQGPLNVADKKDYVFDTTKPPVTIKPDHLDRRFNIVPSAFVDPSGNAILNMYHQTPNIPSGFGIKDAIKFGWTAPGEKEESHYEGTGEYDEDGVAFLYKLFMRKMLNVIRLFLLEVRNVRQSPRSDR